MANTKRTAYKNNWQREYKDRINLTVPKGQKEHIKSHAFAHDGSTNAFINRAISDAIKQDELFDRVKETMATLAEKKHVNIGEQELKELAVAFAALEPKIPDIMDLYFSSYHPPKPQPRITALTPKKSIED